MSAIPKTIDLNLLRVFVQVYQDRRVSLAAEHLELSQPAVSSALNRLRAVLGDKLFVATPRGMQPTPLADELAPRVAHALAHLGDVLTSTLQFDAATSRRQFVLAMTDIGEFHFLPRLMEALSAEAPGASIATLRNTAVNLRFEMETGKVDVALGYLPDLTTDFHRRVLFAQRYVCLFRRGHPLDRPDAARADNEGAAHAVVVSAGTGHGRADELIERAGLRRRIRLRVPHFVALADVLETSDLVATVPQAFALRSVRHFALAFRPHPVELPPIEISLYWHAKAHRDPAICWLRDLVARRFAAP